MNGTQTLAGAAGIGLILANEWTGPDHAALGGLLWDHGNDPAAGHKALVRLAGELLFVLVAVILAGLGGSWPTVIVTALVALWVLWAINRYAPAKKGG